VPEFLLKRGSLQERFLKSTTKIQMYGGGFGNGKTTALVMKSLQLAEQYPGSTGLLARSTYPKLNDTLRKEFIKWCPPSWIKSFPTGQNASNICTLKNGSTIYFRYIAQQGKSAEQTTSNLLSATYDWVGIDQIEDPEITHKDLLDIMGRMRGSTPYHGDEPFMPRTGPRWIMLACNPTGNWVYTKLVRPLQQYLMTGMVTDELLCIRDLDSRPILRDGKPQLLLELIEGSTYELRHIHEADGGDFIQGLESTYTGQQRDRFLLGKWAAYEGLIYPTFDSTTHGLHEEDIVLILEELRANGYEPTWIEGYDYGMSVPSCYLLGFVTPSMHVIIVDGFYKPEYSIDDQAMHIKALRERWSTFRSEFESAHADPSIFGRKTVASKGVVGKTIDQMFRDHGVAFRRGNNDVANGITKVQQYLAMNRRVVHPVTRSAPSPRFFYNLSLAWLNDEFTSYFWKTNSSGERIDVPVDKNDHAMDTVKYLLSKMPEMGRFFVPDNEKVPSWMRWNEAQSGGNVTKAHRYG
jgi:hypothetical protein